MANKTVFIAVRILAAVILDAITYKPDQVVELEAGIANDLADKGAVDKHKDAVAYALAQGATVIRHPAKDPEPEPAKEPVQTSAQTPEQADSNPDNPDTAAVE
jgi:hypothetical protein